MSGFGNYEGECQVCQIFGPLNDLGLCEDCAGKLDLDLIRERDWEYSVSAFGAPPSRREELRQDVIAECGGLRILKPPMRS